MLSGNSPAKKSATSPIFQRKINITPQKYVVSTIDKFLQICYNTYRQNQGGAAARLVLLFDKPSPQKCHLAMETAEDKN